jgi:hypothetical protein
VSWGAPAALLREGHTTFGAPAPLGWHPQQSGAAAQQASLPAAPAPRTADRRCPPAASSSPLYSHDLSDSDAAEKEAHIDRHRQCVRSAVGWQYGAMPTRNCCESCSNFTRSSSVCDCSHDVSKCTLATVRDAGIASSGSGGGSGCASHTHGALRQQQRARQQRCRHAHHFVAVASLLQQVQAANTRPSRSARAVAAAGTPRVSRNRHVERARASGPVKRHGGPIFPRRPHAAHESDGPS